MRTLPLEQGLLDEGRISIAESRLLQTIRDAETKKVRSIGGYRRWIVAAAVMAVLAGIYLLRPMLIHSTPELHTAYGEVRESRLPDGSSVVVNADSKLVFSQGWEDGKDREVWLTGEAFFHVAKTP
ncbi:hypothetical protein ACQ86N_13075 [Puia sp. P3]|uniref:hypothetical protein n=1 Tax=Puia sp. P3 TaxID=3423952 RepID=UPI003D66A0E6